ncbi:MAG: sulfatase [Pseudomonadota bacterium]
MAGVAAPLAAALILHLVLVQPNHPAAMTPGALTLFALELPAILLALLAMPAGHRLTWLFRGVLVATLTLIALLKFADFVSFSTLSRGFNPVADMALVSAAIRLAAGALGGLTTVALCVALVIGVGAVAAALWWATGVWAKLRLPRVSGWAAGIAASAAALFAAAEVGATMGRWSLPYDPPGAAFTARVGVERVEMAQRTLADLAEFSRAASDDPLAGQPGLFDRLDRDLLIIFVESYGRGSLDNPLYADRTKETLLKAETALGEAGYAARSGWLDAPTRGGQSWLSHMSLATGLRIDNQSRYAAALASDRATLYQLASASGHTTAAVMPAITLPWPEARRMGFDTTLAAADLGYAGAAFNWVTMPDQFTLAALDRLLLAPSDAPVIAQIALISSHAPWVPVPDIVPWHEIGDGRIFDKMATSGIPPDRLWRDRDMVRAQYGKAVDYALRTVFEWAARKGDGAPLMLIVGDHQPAEFVAGDARPDVPAHLIGPAAFVDRAADWGWAEGMRPSADGPVDGMETMRDRLLTLIGPPAGERQARRRAAQ